MITSVRSERDVATAQRAGAHQVVVTGGLSADEIVERVLTHAPDGIDHIVEVAFHPNIAVDERFAGTGGLDCYLRHGGPDTSDPLLAARV